MKNYAIRFRFWGYLPVYIQPNSLCVSVGVCVRAFVLACVCVRLDPTRALCVIRTSWTLGEHEAWLDMEGSPRVHGSGKHERRRALAWAPLGTRARMYNASLMWSL